MFSYFASCIGIAALQATVHAKLYTNNTIVIRFLCVVTTNVTDGYDVVFVIFPDIVFPSRHSLRPTNVSVLQG